MSQVSQSAKHSLQNQIINQTLRKSSENQRKLHERVTENSLNKQEGFMKIFNYTKMTEQEQDVDGD